MATFDPPNYTWTAITADEAYLALDAARDLIDAHLTTFAGERVLRSSTTKAAPVRVRLELDLSDMVGLIGQPIATGDDAGDDGDDATPGYPT